MKPLLTTESSLIPFEWNSTLPIIKSCFIHTWLIVTFVFACFVFA
jgi:hypothetical protein